MTAEPAGLRGFGNIVEQVLRHEVVGAHDGDVPFPRLSQAPLADDEVVLQVDDVGLGPVENAVQLGVDIGPRRYAELGMERPGGKGLDAMHRHSGTGRLVLLLVPVGHAGSNHRDRMSSSRQSSYKPAGRHCCSVQLRRISIGSHQHLHRSYPLPSTRDVSLTRPP